MKEKSVIIVQRRLTNYRLPLFEHLREKLLSDGIKLRLLYGEAALSEKTKNDSADILWGEKLATKYFFSDKVCWQPFFSLIEGADLVIVTQENKLICNLWSLLFARPYKLAFWGHGENMQSKNKNGVKEAFKRWTTNQVDWWFAYTGLSKRNVEGQGFPAEKITNLENSIDTKKLQNYCDLVKQSELDELRKKYDLGDGQIGIFIGSLYQDKRLVFLLQAGEMLARKLPNFRLIIIGNGPLKSDIESACLKYSWLRYAGHKVEAEKAQFLKLATVILNPGLVGLGILDSFIAGVPMVTTDCGIHSPEIDYLKSGENGVMTENNLESYVEAVLTVITNNKLMEHLRLGCKTSAQKYTIENMAENFRVGILKALN